MSRHAATRSLSGVDIAGRLLEHGIYVRAHNRRALAEESSEAYKDVQEVVSVLDRAHVAGVVARLRPLGVVKG
jgi:tRNA-splicing ligase RtcB